MDLASSSSKEKEKRLLKRENPGSDEQRVSTNEKYVKAVALANLPKLFSFPNDTCIGKHDFKS